MAQNPGSTVGEEAQIGGKTYIWDGDKWTLGSVDTEIKTGNVSLSKDLDDTGEIVVDTDGYPITLGISNQSLANEYYYTAAEWLKSRSRTVEESEVNLSNPTKTLLQSVPIGSDGYPLPNGYDTQLDANNYFAQATTWLRENGGGGGDGTILIQPNVPDVTQYSEGTLWVDEDTYDLFVLSGGQWIDLTALPDMTDYVKDVDLQFILQEYLRKRDAVDQYYPLERMAHVIQPNGSFRVHLGDGAELDNYVKRIIDLERTAIHLQDQVDNLGGTGEVPPDTAHPDGQYIYIGAGSNDPGDGNWSASYQIDSWNQLTTMYIAETDLDGQYFDWATWSGKFVQAYRYNGDPEVGADFSCSCVFRVNSVQDRGDFCTVNLAVQTGTDRGKLGIGEYFTFEIVDEGTF